jgi:hypothetical protein
VLPLPKVRLTPGPAANGQAHPKPIVQVPPPPPAELKTAEEAKKVARKPALELRRFIDAQLMPGGQSAIPLPYKPVDYFAALASLNPTLCFVALRQLKDMSGPMPNTASGALQTMTKLQETFSKGGDVTALSPDVAVHITGQADRMELVASMLDALDLERLVVLLNNRAKFEDFISACARRSDLTIAEAMAIANYTRNELESITRKLRQKRSEAPASRDHIELLHRANLPTQMQRKGLQERFSEVSPQEREILRKLGFKIETRIAAMDVEAQSAIASTTTSSSSAQAPPVQTPAPAPAPVP